ncbi:hypothetical protein [Streptomyces sp. B5E4]|uniref:hypothetical protein n=1 Tax=Streptomyces sp. B5E4 TaxID=3153568 RepID=UPI00325CB61F
MLKTPTAQLAINGGSQHPDKRKAGGHGPTLADEVEHLLPTPLANMNGPSRREIEAGNPHNRLETAVQLLPTPKATDAKAARTSARSKETYGAGPTLTDAVAPRPGGESSRRRSAGGRRSSAGPPPGQLTIWDG